MLRKWPQVESPRLRPLLSPPTLYSKFLPLGVSPSPNPTFEEKIKVILPASGEGAGKERAGPGEDLGHLEQSPYTYNGGRLTLGGAGLGAGEGVSPEGLGREEGNKNKLEKERKKKNKQDNKRHTRTHAEQQRG